ncbi:16S rRNA (guanine(527)-N(7))-methyltransferase RsmG [Mycoplasmoides gallisepticum]|uniref:Ribosomal RNA small subunit methyltransferase G n=1 Tax=Mycoplasmoides gallisepticum (strain R(low / passage 15 / clone 2)) TaxID=710127 RepID=RSMG_MYCGA|nr:16S rRNA (guanine(527)-N(7))-methyltransferase RsmG [Mycoplasmoides gallisepticum]Q9KX67.1 RecName: Full=Ribosomal RNA small subunit methyltransferase G; AltName: Full=16S rRNA 7-methylguanosine methyltransferase; Short=16S rRNA m7G methyltransferase; AltName: Full=Glucose-inhibited division protein B [Mycoplasmoides gallisepticum str. R(low)]AAF36756.1 glucose inhibited division protein B [Mycoplasmoides gallisepticum]AAP56994.1 ribosomal RNA small subunit methyltransferase G (glucose-inhibi
MLKLIKDSLGKFNLTLTDKQIEDIAFFLEEIYHSNQLFNLTGYKTKELIAEMLGVKTILLAQSLSYIFSNQSLNVIDIGTGAGIPGLIIKIIYPQLNVYLVDSNAKKITFINEVIKKLNFTGVFAILSRVEDNFFLKKYHGYFDYVFSQAVSKIAVLNELGTQLLKINGQIIHFKSRDYQEEIEFAKKHLSDLGLAFNNLYHYQFNSYFLVNVFYNKKAIAPQKYPREWSKIKRELIDDAKH